MARKELKGILPIAPPLCMKKNGRDIDYEMIARCVEYLHEQGIHGYIVLGSMGQNHAVSEKEFNKVVDVCVDATQGSQVCVVGNTIPNTQEVVRRAKYAEDAGADGTMMAAPNAAPITEEEVWEHYRTVNDALDELQILAYNFPPYRGFVLHPEFWVEKLLRLDRVTALKESYADSIHKERLLQRIAHKIHVTANRVQDIWNLTTLGADSALAISESWWAPKIVLEYFEGCIGQPDIHRRSERLRAIREAFAKAPRPRAHKSPGSLPYPHDPPGMGLAWECATAQANVNFTTEWTGCSAGPVRKPYPSYTGDLLKNFNEGARYFVKTLMTVGETHTGRQPTKAMLDRAVAKSR